MVNWIPGKIRSSSALIWLAIGLLAIATVTVLPNYMTGNWAWAQAPTLGPMKSLRALRQDGITLAGWQILEQQTIELGHKQWSVQALKLVEDGSTALPGEILPAQTVTDVLANYGLTDVPSDVTNRLTEEPVFIFLRPQSDAKDEPLVEWIDLSGLQRWTTDQIKSVRLKMSPSSTSEFDRGTTVVTRYARGWNQRYTYAVMQWYAWPTGGSPKISDWFWADQHMQWRQHQRMPWVGVTLMVPMKPLGDISDSQPVVEAIAQSIQAKLVQAMLTTGDPTSG